MKRLIFVSLVGIALAGCETSAPPSNSAMAPATPAAPAVSDLVGARGSSGEMELTSRGFSSAGTRGLTGYWWNGSSQTCVQTKTSQGRYQSVDVVSPASCGH